MKNIMIVRLPQCYSLIMFIIILICCQELQAQVEWTEHPDNPVFDPGPAGSWDSAIVFDPSVIQIGDTLKMWYTGNDMTPAFNFNIGYAWSIDGISWTRLEDPVLTARPDMWDNYGVGGAEVIQDGDTLKMWYVNSYPSGPGKEIGYATSTDGINWNRLDSSVMESGSSTEWDGSFLLGPGAVVKEENIFRMWYRGGNGTFPNPAIIQTGYATSSDGINWEKHDDPLTTTPPHQFSDPVLKVGSPGDFDDIRAYADQVHINQSGYQIWYTGEKNNPRVQSIGYATSSDGIRWKKYNQNPVLSSSGSWSYEYAAASVIQASNHYRMWFTGFSQGPIGKIGYATAPITTDIEENNEQGYNHYDYKLFQNYPNPFNPLTSLQYAISSRQFVSLKVYDVLGYEIAILVNEEKPRGNYKVSFDSTGLSSGVYFYKLTAGDFAETKKMILIR